MESWRPPTLPNAGGNVVYVRLRNICAWAQELLDGLVRALGTHTLIAFAPELAMLLPRPCAVLSYAPAVLQDIEARQAREATHRVTLVWLVHHAHAAFDAAQEALFTERYAAARVSMVLVDVSAFFGAPWVAPPGCPIRADAQIDFACAGLCRRTAAAAPQPFTLVINDTGALLDELRRSAGPLVVLTSMDRLRSWWATFCRRTDGARPHVALAMYHLDPADAAAAELLSDTSLRRTAFVTHKNLQVMAPAPFPEPPDGVVFGCSARRASLHGSGVLKKRYVWEPFFSHEFTYPEFVAHCAAATAMAVPFLVTGHVPRDMGLHT